MVPLIVATIIAEIIVLKLGFDYIDGIHRAGDNNKEALRYIIRFVVTLIIGLTIIGFLCNATDKRRDANDYKKAVNKGYTVVLDGDIKDPAPAPEEIEKTKKVNFRKSSS